MSSAQFQVEQREPITYCALPVTVRMNDIGARVAVAYEQLDLYLASRGIQPNGPGIIRYRLLEMGRPFTIEVGWAIPENTWIDLPYVADVLPAGRYVVGSHLGSFAVLDEVTSEALMWADLQDLTFDMSPSDAGDHWASRAELYLEAPKLGPQGLGGPVEICMKVIG